MAQETQFTNFVIGGETYSVPPLNLYVLDICSEEIAEVGKDLPYAAFAINVLKILSVALDKPLMTEEILKKVSFPEMREFITSMSLLFSNSGFLPVGEAEAAGENLGTGISNLSSQNLPDKESSAEISMQ